jgi:hypothetical protein
VLSVDVVNRNYDEATDSTAPSGVISITVPARALGWTEGAALRADLLRPDDGVYVPLQTVGWLRGRVRIVLREGVRDFASVVVRAQRLR